ncbi:MAG: methylated-DNA--[protein]-cysteine S-methyltransferase [Gemmatimonadota bacterium]
MSKQNLSPRGPGAARPVLLTRPVRLPHGFASAVVAGGRLLAVEWEEGLPALRRATAARYPGARTIDARGDKAGRYLLAYAAGTPVAPLADEGIEIAWERVGAFDRAVLRAAAAVPYGRTTSYGELAARAGKPRAARAAGGALSRNPWPVIVPCHRVVGARGALVGFGKGIAAKRALLRFESAARSAAGRAQ